MVGRGREEGWEGGGRRPGFWSPAALPLSWNQGHSAGPAGVPKASQTTWGAPQIGWLGSPIWQASIRSWLNVRKEKQTCFSVPEAAGGIPARQLFTSWFWKVRGEQEPRTRRLNCGTRESRKREAGLANGRRENDEFAEKGAERALNRGVQLCR